MSEKLEELISLLYQDRLTQYGKRLLVENIEKLQKENKRLKTKIDICNCQEKSCREIIESKYIPKEKNKRIDKTKKREYRRFASSK